LNIKGTDVWLIGYEAALYNSYLCVAIKGYGLVIFDGVEMLNFKVFEHKYILGLAPVKRNPIELDFTLGILIDNQSDENVREFLIELSINSNFTFSKFKLNRVFISSQKVISVKTDPRGLITMFLTVSNNYIVPRSLFSGFSSLLVYVYKSEENSSSIGFTNIADGSIMFSLANDKEEKVITLFHKQGDNEALSCSFEKEGSFFAQITRH
jgi:hypothetical protein